jgi:hypothetical protein
MVDDGACALKVASLVLSEKVWAFNEGLPERPNIFKAL